MRTNTPIRLNCLVYALSDVTSSIVWPVPNCYIYVRQARLSNQSISLTYHHGGPGQPNSTSVGPKTQISDKNDDDFVGATARATALAATIAPVSLCRALP